MDIGSAIAQAITAFDGAVWGVPMVVLLLGTHIFLTVRTRCIQRKLPHAIKLSLTKDPDSSEGDISQFGALASALSATIGTGNIVGVATAITLGGPGAILWMWLTGVFGIATKYSETYAAVKYRVKDHKGEMLGGAMYAWRRAFNKNGKTPRWAMFGAGAFALCAAVASFGIGSAVQSSALTGVITRQFPHTPEWAVGAVIVLCVALVVFGGVQWLSRICEKLVPFMAGAYAIGCVAILCMNAPFLLDAIRLILVSAFDPQAFFGGGAGVLVTAAIQFGCARGLFSNESGLGSAPIVASAAKTRNPARQALVSMTGTFWDTVVICALTGLVLVSTLVSNQAVGDGILWSSVANMTVANSSDLTYAAFSQIPVIGTPILVFGMVVFVYTTIIGWSYYGNRCVTYLFGKRAIPVYQVIYLTVAFLGAVGVGTLVWTISDITNALMAIPNIVMVLMLSGLIARETKHYVYDGNLEEQDTREIPVLDDK